MITAQATWADKPQAKQMSKDEQDAAFVIVLQSVGLSPSSSALRQIIWGGGADDKGDKGGTPNLLPTPIPTPQQ